MHIRVRCATATCHGSLKLHIYARSDGERPQAQARQHGHGRASCSLATGRSRTLAVRLTTGGLRFSWPPSIAGCRLWSTRRRSQGSRHPSARRSTARRRRRKQEALGLRHRVAERAAPPDRTAGPAPRITTARPRGQMRVLARIWPTDQEFRGRFPPIRNSVDTRVTSASAAGGGGGVCAWPS